MHPTVAVLLTLMGLSDQIDKLFFCELYDVAEL